MSRIVIRREVPVIGTPRVLQARGLFDIAASQLSGQTWSFDFDLPESWNVGLIVGPSGAGKSTVARELFGDRMIAGWDWPKDQSVLDGFPAGMGIKDIVSLLNSVGFSSPPAWLRPFHCLSNGEQFRVNLARTLAECPELAVVDEFTSVVDRQVAQVGSHCVAKTVRRRGQKFVAVSCHYDIVDWLDPDWVFEPATGQLTRRLLRRRPPVRLEIYPASPADWPLFSRHHYLDHNLNRSARCFVACIDGQPVAFSSYLHQPHAKVRDIKKAHRLVVLPDYQGLGIGKVFAEWTGEYLAARGYRYRYITSHPALIAAFLKSPRWRYVGGNKPGAGARANKGLAAFATSARRLIVQTFEYKRVPRVQDDASRVQSPSSDTSLN